MAMTMQERFDAYHKEHPYVYINFDVLAKKAIARGLEKFSARTIWHKLRWDYSMNAKEYANAPAQLNNNWTPFYARLWTKNNPEYPDFFTMRETKAEKEFDTLIQTIATKAEKEVDDSFTADDAFHAMTGMNRDVNGNWEPI